MKRKLLFLGFCIFLLVCQVIQSSSCDFPPIFNASNIPIEINTGAGLGFESDNTLQIEVLSGILNATSTYIFMTRRSGEFRFNALNNSELEVSSPDAGVHFDVSIRGTNNTLDLGNSTYELTITTGNNVTILWRWFPRSILDDYTILGLGLGGVILMVASPTWVALGIRKKGITDATIENFGYCLIFEIIGFGLIIVWLWG